MRAKKNQKSLSIVGSVSLFTITSNTNILYELWSIRLLSEKEAGTGMNENMETIKRYSEEGIESFLYNITLFSLNVNF